MNELEQKTALWKQRIFEAYSSGISLHNWLDNNGIRAMTFYRWKRKLIANGDISPDISPRSEGRRQDKIELWKKRINDACHSGLSQRQWCIQNEISQKAFRYWKNFILGCSNSQTQKWKEIILRAYESKLSIREWCTVNNVRMSLFYTWKSILIKDGAIPADTYWLKRKHKRAREFWTQVMLEACSSELPIAEWCIQNSINYGTFGIWKRKLISSNDISINIFKEHKKRLRDSLINSQKDSWKQIVLEAYSRGVTIPKWCEQNSVSVHQLRAWKKYLCANGDLPNLPANSEIADELSKSRRSMWKSRILEAYHSGLNRSEWCRKNHIACTTFRDWEKRFIQSGEIPMDMVTARIEDRKRLWKKLVLAYYESDLGILEWCKQNNVSDTYFYEWKKYLEMTGDIPMNLGDTKKQRRRCEIQHMKEEELSKKYENFNPVFCELPILENTGLTEEDDAYTSKGTTFRVGKFTLSVEEDVSEDMLNAALEALNTVMEVFGND